MIQEIETAIVERLTTAIPNLRVEPFPDDPARYVLKHQIGAVLVGYGRAAYGPSQTTDVVAQECRREFDITVLSRNLRDGGRGEGSGAYGALDLACKALTGFRPAGWRKMMAVRERFLGIKDGVWRYALTMATTGMAIEQAETETPVLLQQVTFDDATAEEEPA